MLQRRGIADLVRDLKHGSFNLIIASVHAYSVVLHRTKAVIEFEEIFSSFEPIWNSENYNKIIIYYKLL